MKKESKQSKIFGSLLLILSGLIPLFFIEDLIQHSFGYSNQMIDSIAKIAVLLLFSLSLYIFQNKHFQIKAKVFGFMISILTIIYFTFPLIFKINLEKEFNNFDQVENLIKQFGLQNTDSENHEIKIIYKSPHNLSYSPQMDIIYEELVYNLNDSIIWDKGFKMVKILNKELKNKDVFNEISITLNSPTKIQTFRYKKEVFKKEDF